MLNRWPCRTPATARAPAARGLSIVELMVGVAVGLFVVAGAAMLLASQLADNRRLLLETQVQQDLRAAADLITRELRRSGHWGKAREGIWYPGTPGLLANPYLSLKPAVDGADFADGQQASTVLLSYSRSVQEMTEDNTVAAAERLGFRLSDGVIQTQLGEGNWQALTDGSTLRVTAFDVRMNSTPVVLACPKACPVGAVDCPPALQLREVTVEIAGEATHDAAVQRSVRSVVRLRNEPVVGVCPA
jgi:type IV pilus assembly protein PilW